MEIRPYPGIRQRQLTTQLDRHLENLELQGYSVEEGVLSQERAVDLSARLDHLWDEQEREFGKERLVQLGEHGTHRGLLDADPVFSELVAEPRVLAVMDAILGTTCILNLQNASAAFPNVKHYQSAFHRDFAKDFVASKPLAINAFWCISTFTRDNGATWVVPGTHRMADWPSAEYIARQAIQMEAPAGAVIYWDGLLLHKAGENGTERVRYGINHMYTRPFIKQQIDFPVFLRDKYPVESRIGQLLGFWTIPPKNVREFRVDPDKRPYRKHQG